MFAASKSGSPAEATDAQFNYVTMLLHGDGTNGAQNNTFLDSSTNNFSITRNGNTTQGTFTPYGSNWSNYFNGTTDYLQIAYNAALDAGTGPFTYEAWLNPSTTTSKQYLGGSVTNAFFAFIGSGTIFVGRNNVAVDFTSSATIVTNQWNHVVIVRNSSNNIAIFINGASAYYAASNTNNYGLASNSLRIGVATTGSSYEYNGYISNVRISKSALYDPTASTITVPTTPLTAVSGTALLTCQSNRFVDNSTNAFAITTSGSPSVQRFSPFVSTTAYSTSVIGGSGYFDGSGDYLTAPNNSAFNLGSNSFTIEAFYYTSSTSDQVIISAWNTNSFEIIYSGGTLYLQSNAATPRLTTTTWPLNQWNHVVFVRSGNTYSGYLNGVRFATTTDTQSIPNVNAGPSIGVRQGGTNFPFNGYISNLRFVNGTAVYDPTVSTLTIPTAPLTAITNTSLLLSYTNGGILDNAMMNDLETVGNAQISTSVKKYGTGSLAFDGTGDYLLLQGGQNFTFGTGDFTIEMWIYVVSGLNADIVYYDGRPTSTNGLYNIIYTNTTGKLIYSANSADRITGTTTLSTGTWYHIALSRSGTSTKLFLSGTQEGGTYTDSNSYIVGANRPVIGGNGYTLGNAPLNGYIDDLRITKGVARYTANFTAPTTAFADKGPIT